MPYKASKYTAYGDLSASNVKLNVLPYYKLENSSIEEIKFKDTDKQRAVYKITSNNNSYCLKKVYYDASKLLFVYSSVEWWYRCGINVPRILPTKNNDRFVNYNDMLFILTPWILGEKCNYDNNNHLTALMQNLGKMHKKSTVFFPIKDSECKESCNILYNSLHKHWQNMLQYSNLAFKYKDNFSKLYIDNFNICNKLGELSSNVSYTINNKNLTRSLCHEDYVNKNLIFNPNNKIYVIDFDKVSIDFIAHDISYALRRILRRDSTNWNVSLCIKLLSEYNEVFPLNLDDYKYILAYLAFPQKYWKISRDYYRNIKKCNKKSFCKILSKSVENCKEQLDFAINFKEYIQEKFNTKF